jgi:hypothetical protein
VVSPLFKKHLKKKQIMAKITYANKSNFRVTGTPVDEKVRAEDMNEIKSVVNALVDNLGYENKTELSFSVAQIEAMGTTPLELLPAPTTSGKTYAFYLVLKKAAGNAWSFTDKPLYIFGGNAHYINVRNLILRSTQARIVHANSGIPSESYESAAEVPDYPVVSAFEQDNDALTLTTWDGDNPTGGNVGLTGTIFWTEI